MLGLMVLSPVTSAMTSSLPISGILSNRHWDVGRRSAVASGRWKSTGSHRFALISLFEPNPGTERLAPKEFHGMCRRIDATRVKAIPLHDGIVFEALIV